MPDVTVYIGIGNSDDRLSQAEWSRYIGDIRSEIKGWSGGSNVLGEWFSRPDSAYQNACFCASFDHDQIGRLRMNLRLIRQEYRQDSIAFAVVQYTELI
jgi:hypothetical protein